MADVYVNRANFCLLTVLECVRQLEKMTAYFSQTPSWNKRLHGVVQLLRVQGLHYLTFRLYRGFSQDLFSPYSAETFTWTAVLGVVFQRSIDHSDAASL